MDLATLIGLASAFGLVVFGIVSGGSLLIFWDAASAMIVIGGTFGVTLSHWSLSCISVSQRLRLPCC